MQRCLVGALCFSERRLGLCHGAFRLVLISACQITRFDAAGHVTGHLLGIGNPGLGQGHLGLRALQLPPSLAHQASQLQALGLQTALQRQHLCIAERHGALTLTGQPQGQRHTHLYFATAGTRAGAIGLALQQHGRRIGRPRAVGGPQ